MAGVSESVRERAGGGPFPGPGFGGIHEGDPVAEARRHLSEDAADQAWREGLGLSVSDAVTLARGDPAA